jgi:PIN domain nuclease of toxin-antitoxin system
VILLDTHAWVWWVHGDACLSEEQRKMLDTRTVEGIGVTIISCWEVAKLVEYGRLKLPQDLAEWLGVALGYPGMRLLDLTPAIVVESTRLSQFSTTLMSELSASANPWVEKDAADRASHPKR